jgi:hypothetical protein
MIVLDIMATLILNYQCFMLVIFVQLSQCCKQYVRYVKTKDIVHDFVAFKKFITSEKLYNICILIFNC